MFFKFLIGFLIVCLIFLEGGNVILVFSEGFFFNCFCIVFFIEDYEDIFMCLIYDIIIFSRGKFDSFFYMYVNFFYNYVDFCRFLNL